MALRNHKRAMTRIFILLVVMSLMCVGVWSCAKFRA